MISTCSPVPGAIAACTDGLAGVSNDLGSNGFFGLSGSSGFRLAFQSSCGDWLFRNSAIGDFAAALEQHMRPLPKFRAGTRSDGCANDSLMRDDNTVIAR